MLRLSTPGNEKFIQANEFDVCYGGGEANVAISLANYGHDAEFVTKVPENPIGECAVANGDANEKITFEVEDTEISAAPNISNEYFMEAKNFKEINMSNVKIKGFKKNEICVSGEAGELNLYDSDELTLVNV